MSHVEVVFLSHPRPTRTPHLYGPVDAPAYIEMASARGWAVQVMGPAMDHLRTVGTTGTKRIASAGKFEDARRSAWSFR